MKFRYSQKKFLIKYIIGIIGAAVAITTIMTNLTTIVTFVEGHFVNNPTQQDGMYGDTYKSYSLGFQISRPSPDWSFDKDANGVIINIPNNSDLLGGIIVLSPTGNNVRVLVLKVDLANLKNFTNDEIKKIKSEYTITSFLPLVSDKNSYLIQIIAKNKSSTLFFKERVEAHNDKVFLIQVFAHSYFSSIPDENMNVLDQVYRSFGYNKI